MGLLSIDLEDEKIANEPMRENLRRLKDFDIYHCLLKGSLSTALKTQEELGYAPQAYLDWAKRCNGGLLFDTILLSTRAYDQELDLDFDTFNDLNSRDARETIGLPTDLSVFAVKSYGDPVCFNSKLKDGKVYQWNRETKEVDTIWDTFEDWLTDEIDCGIQLIADEVLEPLEIKLGGGSDDV